MTYFAVTFSLKNCLTLKEGKTITVDLMQNGFKQCYSQDHLNGDKIMIETTSACLLLENVEHKNHNVP